MASKVFFAFGIFGMGLLAGLNLARLCPNPDYAYGWWKVVAAAGFAIVFSLRVLTTEKGND